MTTDKDFEAQWVKDLPYHVNKRPWYERTWDYSRYRIAPQHRVLTPEEVKPQGVYADFSWNSILRRKD
jgi:hypothetical protein